MSDPEWRTSSPRVLNALLVIIAFLVALLGVYQNHEISVAKSAAIEEYEQQALDGERKRAETPDEIAWRETERVARRALGSQIKGLLADRHCDEALALALRGQVEHPEARRFVELAAEAEECRQETARLETLADSVRERIRDRLAAAHALREAGELERAIEVLEARREFAVTEELDLRRAEIALELGARELHAGDPAGAENAHQIALEAARLLPRGPARLRVERMAAEGLERSLTAGNELALAGGRSAARERVTDHLEAGRTLGAVRLLWSLEEAGDGEAGREAEALLREKLSSGLVRLGGGRVVLAVPPGGTPAATVHLDEFRIGTHEVTEGDYALYLRATGQPTRREWPDHTPPEPLRPVASLTLEEATGYATWLGLRLPTEAEWQLAARGWDDRPYPWGSDEPGADLACIAPSPGSEPARFLARAGGRRDVGSHARGVSPYGCHDMAGNVAEWTTSSWGDGASGEEKPLVVIRGGSYAHGAIAARTTHRMAVPADTRDPALGFRLAGD